MMSPHYYEWIILFILIVVAVVYWQQTIILGIAGIAIFLQMSIEKMSDEGIPIPIPIPIPILIPI